MSERPDDICPRPALQPPSPTVPLAAPLQPSTVYRCDSPEQAAALLAGETEGYVYSRDGHPNATQLAARCAELHRAEHATVTGSGMAALALAMLSQLNAGDHILVSHALYGRSLRLFNGQGVRLGLSTTTVDTCDVAAVAKAMQPNTRLIVVETISNPLLRVPDIAALAETAHRTGAQLLLDNSLASPIVCRPMNLGADLVMESITKIINGHSDAMLGLLCGSAGSWSRVADSQSTWGFVPSPWDCWLAMRGIATLHLRAERASANALAIAEMLSGRRDVMNVSYPGLTQHPDHALATQQFHGMFGNMVAFTLPGGTNAARKFISAAATTIPFCPSLGEVTTTISHPESTSHRTLTADAKEALGITGGTIRLSLGVESVESICAALTGALEAAAGKD